MDTLSTATRARTSLDRLAYLAVRTRLDADPRPTPEEVAQFTDELLAPVEQWCQAHADRVSECYVATHERQLAVYVHPANGSYDHSLGSSLADLELGLHRGGWDCLVLQNGGANATPDNPYFRLEDAIKVFPQAKGRTDANGG